MFGVGVAPALAFRTITGGKRNEASTYRRRLLAAASISVFASGAFAETQRGVTDTEILIGTITDLSGVTAVQGVNNANAVRLAFDEVNEKGGINGRKIRYIVEDSQYQVPRAVQAMNKLLNNDGEVLHHRGWRHADEQCHLPDGDREEYSEAAAAVRRSLDARARCTS